MALSEPSTFEYLRSFIVAKPSARPPTLLEITALETVEYCDGAVKRTRESVSAQVTAGVTGGKVVLPEFTPNDVSGDRFVLHIAGTLDKEPFEITKQFNYDESQVLELSKGEPGVPRTHPLNFCRRRRRYTQQDMTDNS